MAGSYGLDFGTSNTALGSHGAGGYQLIALQEDRISIPTSVFFSFEDDKASFGREAVERYLAGEQGRLMRALKSLLGSSLYETSTSIRRRRIFFSEVLSLFLGFIAGRTAPGSSVLLGRPAHFVDDNIAADMQAEYQLKRAALDAGFRHVEFQFEPIAAAIDYERQVSREQLAFVVDIGGGTSDFSIVRVSPERARHVDRKSDILAYAGVHVGGTDFDRFLSLATVMPFLGFGSRLKEKGMTAPAWYFHDLSAWHRINRLYDRRIVDGIKRLRRDSLESDKLDRLLAVLDARRGHHMLGEVEDAKITLSSQIHADLALADIGETELTIAREDFEQAIKSGAEKIAATIKKTLSLASVRPHDIQAVFLTGGSSGIPMLREMIGELLGADKFVQGDPFGSVATGLAIDAHRRFGE